MTSFSPRLIVSLSLRHSQTRALQFGEDPFCSFSPPNPVIQRPDRPLSHPTCAIASPHHLATRSASRGKIPGLRASFAGPNLIVIPDFHGIKGQKNIFHQKECYFDLGKKIRAYFVLAFEDLAPTLRTGNLKQLCR